MISVIIPAFNEEESIAQTIKDVHSALKILNIPDYEVLVVNDGSIDKTKQEAEKSSATVISNPQNSGYGFSLKKGIERAKYETIIITDADGTYPFNEVPNLYKEFSKGFDMVVGQRTGENFRESLMKSFLRSLLKFVVEFAAGKRIPDINSGMRIFKKKTIKEYFPQLCETFSFTTSATLAYMMNGKFVSFIPIGYKKRKGKSKVNLLKDSFRTILYILQSVSYYNPLKIFILFAATCIILSLIGFMASLFFGLTSGFYLGIGGLLVSLIIISIGLLADILKQILNK